MINLKNGYSHVPLTDRGKPLTAFTVPGKRFFEFKVMPFGLHASAPTFQRLLDWVITPDMAPNIFAYLDDIVVCTQTLEEHVDVHRKILQKLHEANLRQNAEKCQFLGLISWYRRFIKDAARLSATLHKLLKKKAKWDWTEIYQQYSDELKWKLTTAPALACLDWSKPLVLQTDTSTDDLGAVLSQLDGAQCVEWENWGSKPTIFLRLNFFFKLKLIKFWRSLSRPILQKRRDYFVI